MIFFFYGYIELIREKSNSLDALKDYKKKMELQKNKKIKAVKPDRRGEKCGRYDESGRNLNPFARFLHECSIDAQYTMPCTS